MDLRILRISPAADVTSKIEPKKTRPLTRDLELKNWQGEEMMKWYIPIYVCVFIDCRPLYRHYFCKAIHTLSNMNKYDKIWYVQSSNLSHQSCASRSRNMRKQPTGLARPLLRIRIQKPWIYDDTSMHKIHTKTTKKSVHRCRCAHKYDRSLFLHTSILFFILMRKL